MSPVRLPSLRIVTLLTGGYVALVLAQLIGLHLAVHPLGRNGGLRIYLLSDDNFSERQRTYLLAFDWQSAGAR